MRKETDDVTTERLVELTARLVAVLPRGRGFRLGADGSISVYPASPRVRLPAAEQDGSSMPAKRNSRSEQGSKRAPNARTRRSAERAAKHAQGRAQADDRLRQLAGKMAKVQRWRTSQDVWTAFMRDRTPDASTPLAAPTFPAQPAAAPPAPASSPAPALVIAARAMITLTLI